MHQCRIVLYCLHIFVDYRAILAIIYNILGLIDLGISNQNMLPINKECTFLVLFVVENGVYHIEQVDLLHLYNNFLQDKVHKHQKNSCIRPYCNLLVHIFYHLHPILGRKIYKHLCRMLHNLRGG